MDPLSQGVVGASLPQALIKKNPHMKYGFFIAFLAGMAPDLDIFIRSSQDSLLALEFHRQFTHSLLFVPFGALICSFVFHFLFRKKIPFQLNYLYSVLGYLTHGLLDSCTSYGTQLLWPLTNARFSWNNISIVDPLFTLPLLVLILISFFKNNPKFGKAALCYALIYLSLGIVQRQRALAIGKDISQNRGHEYISMVAKPSLGNLILWKIVYETKDKYYTDAVRITLSTKIFEGESINKLDINRDLPWLDPNSQQAKDIERFRWFSMGYIAKHPTKENFIYDVRYSFLPQTMKGLWGIRLSKTHQEQHALFESSRDLKENTQSDFYKMLFN